MWKYCDMEHCPWHKKRPPIIEKVQTEKLTNANKFTLNPFSAQTYRIQYKRGNLDAKVETTNGKDLRIEDLNT